MANIVFLDIDGVLNSDAFYARYGFGKRPALCPDAVQRLDRLCREGNADVVLTTSWRGEPRLPGWLTDLGFSGRIVGMTPRLDREPGADRPNRGDEIAHWLFVMSDRVHAPSPTTVERFVILDDGDDMGELRPHLVQTTQDTGLQDEHVERAIALLAPDGASAG